MIYKSKDESAGDAYDWVMAQITATNSYLRRAKSLSKAEDARIFQASNCIIASSNNYLWEDFYMIHELNEIEKLKVLRPTLGPISDDGFHLPLIRRLDEKSFDWKNLVFTGVGNVKPGNNRGKAILMFRHDSKLQRYWNEPLKYIAVFQSYAFVSTPDYGISPGMNRY